MAPDPLLSTGALISQRRLAAGLTQEALAEVVGVTQTAVSLWEKGVNEPTPTNYRRIAQALDIPLGDLVGSA